MPVSKKDIVITSAMNKSAMNKFKLFGPHMKLIVEIDMITGEVVLGENVTPNEAACQFWDNVKKMARPD
jgi:hypothetical protein